MLRSNKALKAAVLMPVSLLVSCVIVLLMLFASGGYIQELFERSGTSQQIPLLEHTAKYTLHHVAFINDSRSGTYSYDVTDKTISPQELTEREGGSLHEVYQEG